MATSAHRDVGKASAKIPVRLTYKIVELFSDGLYSSPNKAIEELVANGFDAGATNVHIIIEDDRTDPEATIVSVDDGESMDEAGLNQHWILGASNKRGLKRTPKNRRQIGRFGIGKLATFVLARYFTLICKRNGKYLATTIDYDLIPEGLDGGIHSEKAIELALRTLTAAQAQAAIKEVVAGKGAGYSAIPLFGKDAAESWTVAILSGLKPLAREIQLGRLSWVLRSAMPLRPDFRLFLNGDAQPATKLDRKPLMKWTLGKDVLELDKPAPKKEELTPFKDTKTKAVGLSHGALGRVVGSFEVYEVPLTAGKDRFDRSNGFFVFVRDRLINIDDALFGLQPLHHGTFACFRMVVHIDSLDAELRSSRELVRNSPSVTVARNILHACFNRARLWLDENVRGSPQSSLPSRIALGPRSLTRRPLISLVTRAAGGKFTPHYTTVPTKDRAKLIEDFTTRAESDEGIVSEVVFAQTGPSHPMALYHADTGVLEVNALHPFVESYIEEYQSNSAVNLIAWAEVISEAFLFELSVDPKQISSFLKMRDELLRALTRHIRKPATQVAQDLVDAANDQDQLEIEVVNAFTIMGFEAIRIGGSGKPDGKAEAALPAEQGSQRRYSVSLEAKSAEEAGKKVSAKDVGVSRVVRHREDNSCDHAVVVGHDFPAKDEAAALVKEMSRAREESERKVREEQTGRVRTITLVRIADLAKLVRLVALKGIGLDRLRNLFETCQTPAESGKWIGALEDEAQVKPPFREILEAVWSLGKETPAEAVELGQVALVLRREKKLTLDKATIRALCTALSSLTNHVVVRSDTVELNQRPDVVLGAIQSAIKAFPADERGVISFEP